MSRVPDGETHPAYEGRNKSNTGFSTRDGLAKAEEEGEVAMDTVFLFKFARSLNALPR